MTVNRLSFNMHLEELRRRLIYSFAALAVFFTLCYIFSEHLVSFLFHPVRQALPYGSTLVFTALTEGFITYIKVSFWSALILATPVIMLQLWWFIAPGLYMGEKKTLRRFMFWGMLLFAAGGCFGYWVIMPAVLSITLGFADQGLEPMPRLRNYLLFSLKTIFTFGLIGEIPFLMAFTVKTGMVSGDYFRRNRKVSYIGLYVLAVMLVPTDIFSQLLLFCPLMAMYEVGIRLSQWLGGRNAESVDGDG